MEGQEDSNCPVFYEDRCVAFDVSRPSSLYKHGLPFYTRMLQLIPS